MAKNNESKLLKQFEADFNQYLKTNYPQGVNTKEGITHAMNQFMLHKLQVPKELEEIFSLFILHGLPLSRWACKYRLLPYIQHHIMPDLEIQMLYANDKQYAHLRGLVEQLIPAMEKHKEQLALMPEDEQEWIDLKGPDYKTAE